MKNAKTAWKRSNSKESLKTWLKTNGSDWLQSFSDKLSAKDEKQFKNMKETCTEKLTLLIV
jgi:hypothetical protein